MDKMTKERTLEYLAELKQINETYGIDISQDKNTLNVLNNEKEKLQAIINQYTVQLCDINSKFFRYSNSGIQIILKAIENENVLHFVNNDFFMDKNTGLIGKVEMRKGDDYSGLNTVTAYDEMIKVQEIHSNDNWTVPDKIFVEKYLNYHCKIFIKNCYYFHEKSTRQIGYVSYDSNSKGYGEAHTFSSNNRYSFSNLLIFDDSFCNINNYIGVVNPNNDFCTQNEKTRLVLEHLIILNSIHKLQVKFNDEKATKAFEQIFVRKPEIEKIICEYGDKTVSLENDCNKYNSEILFNYTSLLAKYDVKSIDDSIIKYFHAIQQWTCELMDKLDCYEQEKERVINNFNIIGLKLAKKYENSEHLTDDENALLCNRQRYFASRFSLGMNGVKTKILAVKHQADELEYRIDEIDNGDDAIHQLALLEKEERASFTFIAENTAKIVCNALKKIEFFEANHDYVVWAINAWETWSDSYRIFKTTYREDLKGSCEDDGIEEEIWQKWYCEWQSVRFKIEEKFQPIIEKELHERIPMIKEDEISVAQQIVVELEMYRNNIDDFYREERKGIYQNFAFQSNGDIQDKLEAESKLYKITASLQSDLQDIIFNCSKAEDRIFILNWSNSILDIQVDDILSFAVDNDLQTTLDTVLTEFSQLKHKNYEIYLADAKSYGEEQARRDKQFNSLIFKMRKGLK